MIVIEAALQKRAFKQLQNTTEKFGKNFNTHFKTVLNRSIAEGVKQSVKNVKGAELRARIRARTNSGSIRRLSPLS
jgi:hypothetical protein